MAIYYYKLFDFLSRKNIKKGELCNKADISGVTLSKMARHGTIQTDIIGKICDALGCQPGDIMENIPADGADGGASAKE